MVDKLLPDLESMLKSDIDPANDILLVRDVSDGYDKKFNPPTTITVDLLKDGGIVLDDTAGPSNVGLGNVPNEDATDMANFDQKGATDGQAIVWDSGTATWAPSTIIVPVDSVNGQTGDVSLSASDIGGNVSAFTNDANYVSEGNNVSLLTNDANYVSQGDNVSELTNDANYVSQGDNVSKLNNDANYTSSGDDVSFNSVTTDTINSPDPSTTAVTVNDDLTVTGTLTESSALKYKTNIRSLENSLQAVLNLDGVLYDKYSGSLDNSGFIAEEVDKVIPNVVTRKEDEIEGIQYTQIIAYLVESIKELNEKIERLEQEKDDG